MPDHQVGFTEMHPTIDQVHRFTAMIKKALEDNLIKTYKLNKMLPIPFADILQSYILNRMFRVRQEVPYSNLMPIKARVPQKCDIHYNMIPN